MGEPINLLGERPIPLLVQILEMNFIQQYCDYKNGELKFSTQWPAKLDGNVSVENKSSTTEPTAGGFSFKLGKVDDSVSSEPGSPEVDGEPTIGASDVDLGTAAADITGSSGMASRKERETAPRRKR